MACRLCRSTVHYASTCTIEIGAELANVNRQKRYLIRKSYEIACPDCGGVKDFKAKRYRGCYFKHRYQNETHE